MRKERVPTKANDCWRTFLRLVSGFVWCEFLVVVCRVLHDAMVGADCGLLRDVCYGVV